MKVGAIILARLDSARLPGKQLIQIAGRPIIWYLLQRLRQAPTIDRIILATSDRPVDSPLAEWAAQEGLDCFRGSANDVAGRTLAAARRFDLDAFARVNGDSPFLPADLLEQAARTIRASEADMITNVPGRTYPYGCSVEIVRTAAYEKLYPRMSVADQEHVTSWLYAHPDSIRMQVLKRPTSEMSGLQLAIDTPQDLDWFAAMTTALGPGFAAASLEELVAIRRRDAGKEN